MNNYDEEWWIHVIRFMPEDFFIKVKDEKVCLYYRGEDHETFTHPAEAGQLLERDACLIFFVSVTQSFLKTQYVIHSTILEVKKKIWEKRLGQLPDSFYIKVSRAPQTWEGFHGRVHYNERSSFQLFLYYNGPGYEGLTESGGKKPPEDKDYAFLCMHAIPHKQEEVVSCVLRSVKRTQEELSG